MPYDKLSGNEPLETDLTLTTSNIIAVQGPLTTTSSVRGSNSKYIDEKTGLTEISTNTDINRLVNNFDTTEVIGSKQYYVQAAAADNKYKVTYVTDNGFHDYKENDQTEG